MQTAASDTPAAACPESAQRAAPLWTPWIARAQEHPSELLSIQYLRAIAALGVLVFHAAERAGVGFGPGAAGVDVFFVISGFIMWVITGERRITPQVFLARRAARIIPLYWLVTLAIAVAAIAAPWAFPHLRPAPDHVLKSLLFYPHVDPSGDIAPLVVPGWTLNYEMFFYVIFAASLLLAVRRRAAALTLAMCVLVVFGYWARPAQPALATYTNPLLLEFLAGVWLGKAWTWGIRPCRGIGLAAIAAGVMGFALVTASGINVEPVRIFVWGVPAFLIVAGAVTIEPLRDWPAFKFLGDASYSIYLVHGLAISFCARVLTMVHISSLPLFFFACISGGVVLGGACYLLVERPLLHLFHPSRRNRLLPRADHVPVVSPVGALARPPDAVR